MTVILAILVFCLLVVSHEFGHFIAAKKSGIRVNEFWIGMGPVLFKKQVGETSYQIRLLPIGGAVVMEGEDTKSDDPRSFSNAKIYKRAIVLVAGATMNFILGYLLIFATTIGAETLPTRIIESFAVEGLAYVGEDGLQEGDEILKINSSTILLGASDMSMALAEANGEPVDIKLRRDGKTITLEDVPIATTEMTIDGITSQRYGFSVATEENSFLNTLDFSFRQSLYYGKLIWMSLGSLFSGEVGADQLTGVVGVTQMISETASYSIYALLSFVAFISINLGVMNLLPLPALDGGRLLFLFIEFIRGGKPVSAKYEGYVHGIGLLLLFALMIYVTYNDIVRLITG